MTELIGEVGTDFDVFSRAGLPGMHFVYMRDGSIYHTMADDVDRVGRGSLQHHGTNALAIARHFGNMDLTAVPDSGSSVFFTIRPLFVHYPAVWALVLAITAVALFVVWAVSERRRSEAVSLRVMARSTGASALAVVAGAAAGTLVWMGLAALRPSPTVPEVYAYLAAITSLGALVARRVERIARRSALWKRRGRVTLWVTLALATAIGLPGFSYLFVWPALAGIAGLLWHPRRRGWAIARFAIVAAPAVLLMTPAIDYLFLFAQPRPGNPDSQMTAAALMPMLLGLLVVQLLGNRWHRPDAINGQAYAYEATAV
jgi:hypothetical protein